MISPARLLVWCLLGLSTASSAWSQELTSSDRLWRTVGASAPTAAALQSKAAGDGDGKQFVPANARLFDLDSNVLSQLVAQAIPEAVARERNAAAGERTITVPLPDGSFERFELIEAPVMSAALQAKFPEIRSYRGRALNDPLLSMRMDVSPLGLHVQVLAPEGTVIVDPTPVANRYQSYSKRSNRDRSEPFRCAVQGRAPQPALAAATNGALATGTHLRTYRLAVACTSQYAQRFGGTVSGAMAAIHTTVNRVVGIYERELAVRLELVDDNEKLIFTPSAPGSFNNADAFRLIDQSQAVIDARIGDANYDIGHTFSTGAGGLAGLGVVGQSGSKARGVTGRADPVGDPFDVDYVAHEMGHQFGGDHTFNGVSGSCGGDNRNAATAVEPGSGSTIQAYAGICSPDDLQLNSDPYFHCISLAQIAATVSTVAAGHGTLQPTGNAIPAITAGRDYIIPKQTPFQLTAQGSDPDGDPLLFCWEQLDTGPAAAVNTPDDGHIPLYRSFDPTESKSRVFPRWSDILAHTVSPGEQMPVRGRTLSFRVTARDARSGGGAVASDDATVQVHAQAGPFQVTAPSDTSLTSHLVDVRWDVAQTNVAPINCQQVNIRLSTDGGNSFVTTLATSTPNDGHELVALPASVHNNLRLLVEATDNIFFAVSKTNFNIAPAKVEVYITRHAERESGADAVLTPQGQLRANRLAEMMSRIGITQVYVTNTRRSQQTAAPTVTATGAVVTTYEAVPSVVSLIESLGAGEKVLIVGHSNTVGDIASGLGASPTPTIDESEFNHLLFVGLTDSQPQFMHFTLDLPPTSQGPGIAATPSGARLALAPSGEAHDLSLRRLQRANGAFSTTTLNGAAGRSTSGPASAVGASAGLIALDQNWNSAERNEFYSLRQGSPLMRKIFFDALEQTESTQLLRDDAYLASFGFLPLPRSATNPDGYPVGFVGQESIELNCAACHTSQLTVADRSYLIDGGQAMIDLDSFQHELVRSLKLTLADAPELSGLSTNMRIPLDQATKFGRFARRVIGTASPSVSQARVVAALLKQDYQRRQQYNDFNDYGRSFESDSERAAAVRHSPYGFGRIDALGAILNQGCAVMLQEDGNAQISDAPVGIPAIWDAPQHTHVQWNGSVDNTSLYGPLGRNVGQVIGVFGIVRPQGTLVGYDSSVNFDALDRAETLMTKLWSPHWPVEFGLDETLAAAGQQIYQRNCVTCHALMKRDDPNRRAHDVLVPLGQPFGSYPALATDQRVASNWRDRTAKVGLLAGRDVTLPFRDRFPDDPEATAPSRDILTHLVFQTITRSFVPWREELTIDDAQRRLLMFAATEDLMRYKARPLNGVWSTAPYLHNGSVPDMMQLLKKPAQRKSTFRVGTTEFDPATLGYKDAGPFVFDTSLDGNKNSGHDYGTDLTEDEKLALLEFLKTL